MVSTVDMVKSTVPGARESPHSWLPAGDLFSFAVLFLPRLYVALPFFTLHSFNPHIHSESGPNNSTRGREEENSFLSDCEHPEASVVETL